MMKRVALAVSLLACGAPAATSTPQDLPKPAAAKTYSIHMARALHVGQKLHMTSDAEESRTTAMTRQGSVIDKKKSRTRMHLDAVITVLSLDDKRDALRAEYAVADLSESGDKLRTLLHDQRVDLTRARKEDDAVVLVDGAPASSDVREALRMVTTFRTGGPSDDEVFGSKQPQPVGAHWPIDAKLAHDDLVEAQGEFMQDAVLDGDVTLAGVVPSNGVDCLDLRAVLNMSHINVPDAPKGSTVLGGNATATFQGLFPLDDAAPRLLDKLDFTMTMKLKVPTPSGDDVIVAVEESSHRERGWTAL